MRTSAVLAARDRVGAGPIGETQYADYARRSRFQAVTGRGFDSRRLQSSLGPKRPELRLGKPVFWVAEANPKGKTAAS